MRSYWTYILTSRPRGTLYIGVTNGLIQRIEQHRAGTGSAFMRRYRVHTLVWYEEFASARDAIQREKPQTLQPRLEDQPDRMHQPALG
jgi:putative endonuclease